MLGDASDSGRPETGHDEAGAPRDAATSAPDVTPYPFDGGGPCKRGIATTLPPAVALAPTASIPGVSWYYNWATKPTSGADPNVEFEPMIWGSGSLPATIPSNARYLLGFNEPNLSASGSADMTPQQAASDWPQVEALAGPLGIPIASPAVNLCSGDCVGAPDPYTWLQDFFSACSGCEVDFVAVHFYGCALETTGPANDPTEWIGLEPYLENFYRFGKPIWLTEFSCDASQTVAAQTAYMQAAIPYLESNPHVYRYSWFSASNIPNAMLQEENGSLTSLGSVYASLPQSCK